MSMSSRRVIHGDFASAHPDASKKKIWNYKKLSVEGDYCDYRNGPIHFQDCIVKEQPLVDLDDKSLFDQVRSKHWGRVAADTFSDLTASHNIGVSIGTMSWIISILEVATRKSCLSASSMLSEQYTQIGMVTTQASSQKMSNRKQH